MNPRTSAIAAVAALLILSLAGCAPEQTPRPTPSATASESPDTTPTATPTPTPIASAPTCESTSTDEWHAMMARFDWVSWEWDEGASPFDEFPGGTPDGFIACTWGADPNLGTDNVSPLAWAPIEPDAAAAAQAQLEAQGFDRIESPEGVYLAQKAEPSWADAEGYGSTYLFTDADVRYAMYKDEVGYVKAPDEVG